MHGKTSFQVGLSLLAFVIVSTLAPLSFAGGFYLEIERPSASNPAMRDVVVVARPYGCHKPEDAQLTATAEGIVNGKRVSVPLQFTHPEKGLFAIKKQWDANGAWVLAITAEYNKAIRSVIVELGAKGDLPNYFNSDGKGFYAHNVQRQLTAAEIDNALKNVSTRVAKAARL
jgi:hypothetical protein